MKSQQANTATTFFQLRQLRAGSGSRRTRRYVFAAMLTAAAGVVALSYCNRWAGKALQRTRGTD